MALQTVVQKRAVVEPQPNAPAMHHDAELLGTRLSQLSALLFSAASGGLASLNAEQRSAYLYASLNVSKECERIVCNMPLPSLE